MKNVMPFPLQTNITKQKEENHKKKQPFSYFKMTLAIVIGNLITLAGLFAMFLIFLNMTSPMID